jgi:glutamate-1-semialdehyde 2,1-aminomutase
VRIARAASGRSKVAFCGYHGWHDWYLSTNLQTSSNLDQHLLSGLDPKGVPAELAGTALPFRYNQLDELEALATRHGREIGVIIMEPVRSVDPAPGFLAGVRQIADRLGAVLIFDEITSGFRLNVGGAHLRHSVTPDVAVFGKALGNGYPIAAIIGKRSVMNAAQESFISSTFWTERIGPVAALATSEFMAQHDVPAALVRYGQRIMEGWRHAAAESGLHIQVSGIPPLARLAFAHPDALALQTLYTQEMLYRGYLVGAAVYTSYAYSDALLERFATDTANVFKTIKRAVDAGTVRAQLRGPVKHAGFARLS